MENTQSLHNKLKAVIGEAQISDIDIDTS